MSSTHSYEDFKSLPRGQKRREATRRYLQARPGIRNLAATRAGVTGTMVSKVLHGNAISAKVEQALLAEENHAEYSNGALAS